MNQISAVINVCNEAHHLRDCVTSVRPLVDEVLVCDMESSDGSAQLALELGCKVITHRKLPAPEPEARIAAIEAVAGDWVLVFDPDMRISADTCRKLREITEQDGCDAVDFYLNNYVFGRLCRHGHGSQPVFRKLFKKAVFRPVSRNIQTFWHDSVSGRVLRLGREDAIIHLSYDSVERCVETLSRYAKREAEQAHQLGSDGSTVRMIVRPLRRFLGNYFMRLGVLDGVPGLILSVLVSVYLFLTEAYLWDLSRTRPAKPQST